METKKVYHIPFKCHYFGVQRTYIGDFYRKLRTDGD